MQALGEMLKELGRRGNTGFTYEEYLRQNAEEYNAKPGTLTGYECPKCKSRGDYMTVVGTQNALRECECMAIRRNLQMIENSGLKDLLEEYTFERYQIREPWQRNILETAQRYVQDHGDQWFWIGGQVGCGKTHICTAIVDCFLRAGMPSRYMLWRDAVVQLKGLVNDAEYGREIGPYKTVPVLYIDDFFKTEQGKRPTAGDVHIAFEILNYRYNNKGLLTIISSERNSDELMDIDEATGSRIYQRTKGYCLNIGQDRRKNWRLNREQ